MYTIEVMQCPVVQKCVLYTISPAVVINYGIVVNLCGRGMFMGGKQRSPELIKGSCALIKPAAQVGGSTGRQVSLKGGLVSLSGCCWRELTCLFAGTLAGGWWRSQLVVLPALKTADCANVCHYCVLRVKFAVGFHSCVCFIHDLKECGFQGVFSPTVNGLSLTCVVAAPRAPPVSLVCILTLL